MWGVVAWEKTPGGRDKNNPDVSKQNRPTLGMPILIDMKKKPGVDQWQGQVYNAKDGQFYSSTIKPIGSDQLEIQGCVLGFLCGRETCKSVVGPVPSTRSPKHRVKSPPRPIRSVTSVYSRISRGFPISAGWNNSTAASVVTSESAKSLPMLEVPG